MAIIGFIIKIILYILLGILGVLVLLLMGVVFLPIHYYVEVAKYKDTDITIKVKLFKLIGVNYLQNENVNSLKFDVFGIKVFEKDLSEQEVEYIKEVAKETAKDQSEEIIEGTIDLPAEDVVKEVKEVKEVKKTSNKTPKKQPTKKISTKKKLKSKKKINFLGMAKKLWYSEYRREALKHVIKCGISILKVLMPKSVYFNLTIGKDNPGDTGVLIAKLILLYPWYCRYGIINGNYEEEGFWGEIELSGRFNIYELIKPIIILVFNNSVRSYTKIILKLREDD